MANETIFGGINLITMDPWTEKRIRETSDCPNCNNYMNYVMAGDYKVHQCYACNLVFVVDNNPMTVPPKVGNW